MKIDKKFSVVISQVLTAIIFVLLIVSVFLIPWIVDVYITVLKRSDELRLPTMIFMYFMLLPAYTADISLWLLLRNIKNGEIFTGYSVKYLRRLSWCCFAEAILFLLFGYYYLISLLISFAAVFMGVVIRVVKNVIEEAVSIKNENDYTI